MDLLLIVIGLGVLIVIAVVIGLEASLDRAWRRTLERRHVWEEHRRPRVPRMDERCRNCPYRR
jgi:hypothetical protein